MYFARSSYHTLEAPHECMALSQEIRRVTIATELPYYLICVIRWHLGRVDIVQEAGRLTPIAHKDCFDDSPIWVSQTVRALQFIYWILLRNLTPPMP